MVLMIERREYMVFAINITFVNNKIFSTIMINLGIIFYM